LNYLRWHVFGSACKPIQTTLRWVDIGGQSKVAYFAYNPALAELIFQQQDVVRFDISVDDVLVVQELQCEHSLVNDLACFKLKERLGLENCVQITSHKQLLNYEEVRDVLEDIVHPNDVRVFRVHQNFKLVDQQIVDCRFLREQRFFEDFESELLLASTSAFDPALKDLAESTLSD